MAVMVASNDGQRHERIVSAAASDRRRNRASPIRQVEARYGRSTLRRASCPKARARRLGRHHQQDGAYRVGGHGARHAPMLAV